MYPALFLTYFMSNAVILLESMAFMVKFSLLYKEAGRVSVLYNFILVVFKVFCGLNVFFTKPIIFKQLFKFFFFTKVHLYFTIYQNSYVVTGIYLFYNFVIYYNFTSN